MVYNQSKDSANDVLSPLACLPYLPTLPTSHNHHHSSTLGSFTEKSKNLEEIACIRGTTVLDISRLDEEGNLVPLISQPTFSDLRSLAVIRPVGASKVSRKRKNEKEKMRYNPLCSVPPLTHMPLFLFLLLLRIS